MGFSDSHGTKYIYLIEAKKFKKARGGFKAATTLSITTFSIEIDKLRHSA
jgi:hypothetical protein